MIIIILRHNRSWRRRQHHHYPSTQRPVPSSVPASSLAVSFGARTAKHVPVSLCCASTASSVRHRPHRVDCQRAKVVPSAHFELLVGRPIVVKRGYHIVRRPSSSSKPSAGPYGTCPGASKCIDTGSESRASPDIISEVVTAAVDQTNAEAIPSPVLSE
jgi:hypothetical protein